jgi:hypothetical protein
VSIVRWRNLPHTLVLFFFSGRDDIGTAADEPTLLFGFPGVVAGTSALRFALAFECGGEGAGTSSFTSSSSSPESPAVPSSSSSDLSDESVSSDESLDSGVFCGNLAP